MIRCNPNSNQIVREVRVDSLSGAAPIDESGAPFITRKGYESDFMSHLEHYTPEICARLRQIAECRDWTSWRSQGTEAQSVDRSAIEEEIELTYHLHVAAEASGARTGMPPIGRCPIQLAPGVEPPDPVEFLSNYLDRHYEYSQWPQRKSAQAGQHCSN